MGSNVTPECLAHPSVESGAVRPLLVDPVVQQLLADRVQRFDQPQLGLGVLRLLLLFLEERKHQHFILLTLNRFKKCSSAKACQQLA